MELNMINRDRENDNEELKEASKRQEKGISEEVEFQEIDDMNEVEDQEQVSNPDGDSWAENKISTSLDDE
jgi:hypothetical protein